MPNLLPINSETVFHLALIGVALSGALAMQFGWLWRTVLLFLAVALTVGFLWSEAPTGQYVGLAYLIILGASAIALVLGVALGCVLRFAASGVLFSIAAIFFVAASATGFELYRQYVPNACLESPLQVRIAGKVLRIPPELRPRLENGDDIGHFGRIDRKLDFARFCSTSENGTHAIDMDTVWLTPASNHSAMSSACNAKEPPNWCDSYSPEPYRYIGKILFAPEATPGFPLPYWKEGGSLKKNRQGDLSFGSVCLLPDADTRTQCWIWQLFGDGSRLTVSTNNLDPTFDEMPIEVAREMIRQAREVTLSIVDQ
ncbi:hypothetical protein ACSQ76_06900 [Roseovarius sp. B08]|uniref:hypothetical protein n=1 Tax=Roseovarius sp. B08 TaxID=3449223 RepID=UPI003EDBC14A